MRRLTSRLLRSFLKADSGNIAILAGLLMPSLILFGGYGAETAYWYYRERDIQGAADIAAYSATVALRAGKTTTAATAIATAQATANGRNSATGTISVHTPPTSGAYQNNKSVQVILVESQTRYLTALLGGSTVPLSARSTATYVNLGPACMLALSKSASGAMTFWGNAFANLTDCNVVSNSMAADAFKVGGSADVTTPCVSSAGGAQVSADLTLTSCATVNTNAVPSQDPYAAVPAPTIPATCSSFPGSGTATPGKFCGGVTINSTIDLDPGVYVISGGQLRLNASANVTGTGVTFYLTNGATLFFNGSAHMNLTAPTSSSDPLKGLVFFGDRTQANATNTINGNASSEITGAIYFPSQEVRFLGNFSGANDCVHVIANTVYYTGSATFQTDCPGTGMSQIFVPGAVSFAVTCGGGSSSWVIGTGALTVVANSVAGRGPASAGVAFTSGT